MARLARFWPDLLASGGTYRDPQTGKIELGKYQRKSPKRLASGAAILIIVAISLCLWAIISESTIAWP